MFWNGNYIVVRELNFLLKEENVTLTQVLEADDILQECKADNKALIQFLTKPEILAELISLITEEPPKDVEMSTQYRHASLACEVLTSQLSMLSDRLSSDAAQMNRLCDFINKEPPLNPLLASYFSKTVEMLLERSPKQDWYLYHIVCLRVLDFFKSRRDFLPNLLRHIATSAVADTFKCLICLDELFNKVVMEWLEEHQFLESLIQIICGTYVPEELSPPAAPATPPAPPAPAAPPTPAEEKAAAETLGEKGGEGELNHKADNNGHEQDGENAASSEPRVAPAEGGVVEGGAAEGGAAEGGAEAEARAARMAAVASANAAALLCEIILNGCVTDQGQIRGRTSSVLVSRLQSEGMVRLLLQSMFTSPPAARRHAIVNGARVVQALTNRDPILPGSAYAGGGGGAGSGSEGEGGEGSRGAVELAVAPHLPLLHQALLQPPDDAPRRVGAARVEVATLLAQLAVSEVQEVPTTMLTLGTPAVLVDMFLEYKDNNFLHAAVYNYIRAALSNQPYRTQYARHLIVECDILTRLMDVFEENENKQSPSPRSGHMGHVVLTLRRLHAALDAGGAGGGAAGGAGDLAQQLALPGELEARWRSFTADKLAPLLQDLDTPLGGYYPSENIYEFNDMVSAGLDDLGDDVIATDANEVGGGGVGGADFLADCNSHTDEDFASSRNSFLELASNKFSDYTWDEGPDGDEEDAELEAGEGEGRALDSLVRDLVHDPLSEPSPWESSGSEGREAADEAEGEGWAQFGSDAFSHPADPFAPPPPTPARTEGGGHDAFWTYNWSNGGEGNAGMSGGGGGAALEARLHELRLEGGGGGGAGAGRHEHDATSVELANNLLTAMSSMTPEVIANIVNANMPDVSDHAPSPPAPAPAPPAPSPDAEDGASER